MLKEIIERGREMEDKYGHFFDYILVNQDMDRAYEELLQEINRLEVEPQWVPIQWVDSQSLERNQLVNKLFIYITWPAIVYGPHNGEGSTVVGLLKVVVIGNLQRGPFFLFRYPLVSAIFSSLLRESSSQKIFVFQIMIKDHFLFESFKFLCT